MYRIAVIILAAGSSSRMGSPKQLLKWGDKTLITHVIETVLQLKIENISVVLGANYELISEHIKGYPITILNNQNWKLGLGKSIAYATQCLMESNKNIDGVLFVLADQPFVNATYLNEILNSFNANKNAIIATSYNNNIGVPVLFDKKYFNALINLKDDNGAKHILKHHESYVKALIPPNKNVDLDTKEDYNTFFRQNFDT